MLRKVKAAKEFRPPPPELVRKLRAAIAGYSQDQQFSALVKVMVAVKRGPKRKARR